VAGWPNPKSAVSLHPFQKNDPIFPRSVSMCIFVFPSFSAFVTQLYKIPLKPGKRLVICYSPQTCFWKPHVGPFIGYLYPHKWCPPLIGAWCQEPGIWWGVGMVYPLSCKKSAWTSNGLGPGSLSNNPPTRHSVTCLLCLYLRVVWKGLFGEVPNIIQLFLREKYGHWSEAM